MIQRKQTLFLLLAVVLSVVTLSLPIAEVVSNGWKAGRVYCLMSTDALGHAHYDVVPLFVWLLATATLNVFTIFLFRRRPLQARLCLGAVVLYLLWYVLLAVYSKHLSPDAASFQLTLPAVLPLVAAILSFMARRGVLADERLVRAADRLRG